jgi:high-affinity nickel-transport protein
LVALYIGTLELMQVMANQLSLTGGLWNYASNFNINQAGMVVVAMFVVIWAFALLYWKYGKVEARWDAAAFKAQTARGETPNAHLAGIELGGIHAPFTIDE